MPPPNVQIDSEAFQQAITAAIAGQILDNIDPAQRDAIMREAIAAALKSWSLKSVVEKAVMQRAAEIAAELCMTEEWGDRIADKVREGFVEALDHARRRVVDIWSR